MDQLWKSVKNTQLGYRLGTHKINILFHADDALLITESEDDLQRMLHAFNKKAEELNMAISKTKTKCMTTSKESLRYRKHYHRPTHVIRVPRV